MVSRGRWGVDRGVLEGKPGKGITLSTGSPMEELEKGPKELKGFVAP